MISVKRQMYHSRVVDDRLVVVTDPLLTLLVVNLVLINDLTVE